MRVSSAFSKVAGHTIREHQERPGSTLRFSGLACGTPPTALKWTGKILDSASVYTLRDVGPISDYSVVGPVEPDLGPRDSAHRCIAAFLRYISVVWPICPDLAIRRPHPV